MDYNCEYSTPVDWEGQPASNSSFWSWKNVECNASGTIMISDGNYSAYIEKKIDLGDIFLILFLTIFLGFLVFKFVWDWVFPRIVKIKNINNL